MDKNHDPVVIVGCARTPIGAMQGVFNDVSAPELGAVAIKAAVKHANAGAADIQEVLMGCVLSAGLSQAPARQAAFAAGLPFDTGSTTVNKMCGSGMKCIMLAHDLLCCGANDVMVAGGMESMTNAPYLLMKARGGYRMGHGEIKDHMFFDGLEDAYESGRLMGSFAEDTAMQYRFSRERQDEFAITSLKRAQSAIEQGDFAQEIAPVTVRTRKGEVVVRTDEGPSRMQIDKISQLRPVFKDGGTVTAANASSISDGAAACVLMRLSIAERRGFKPLAKIVGHASHSQAPALFTTAPVGAVKSLLQKVEWPIESVDLFEINEAFAVVTMAAMDELGIAHDIVNIYGGACALGHPIGASGARIIVTLLTGLMRNQLKRGVASICIGGGEATAIAIERFDA